MKLQHALLLNAAITASCAAISLLSPSMVSDHVAVGHYWVVGLGWVLLLYVPILLFVAARPVTWMIRAIILLDWAFVAFMGLYALWRASGIDPLGWVLIGVPTGLVALVALLQDRGLSRERSIF
jgi:hypothetical protein